MSGTAAKLVAISTTHAMKRSAASSRLLRPAHARAEASPFMIFHDMEYRENDADIEVCIPVKGPANHAQKMHYSNYIPL